MDEQQKQTILDLPKVIAVGIASPVATVLTSRFGVAGTLIGLALSAVVLTALADILKVYLARAPATVAKVPHTVAKAPGGLRARLSWRNIRGRLRAAFARFSYLPPAPARRRSILIGSVVAAGISFLVGLSAVTALELGAGKSLSCWAWDDCPTESSTDGGRTSITSTLPSVLGGGQSASGGAAEVQSPPPEQPSPGAPGSPSRPEGVPPGSEQQPQPQQQPGSPQPGQRSSPSGIPEEGEQQQQPGSSGTSEEDEWRSTVGGSEEDQQQEDRSDQPSSGSDQEASGYQTPWVPWST